MTARPAAIVLAAGASVRMGRAKALLVWRGRSFVRTVVELAERAAYTPVIVVEGAVSIPPSELAQALRVENPSWALGQLSSLQVGLGFLRRLGHRGAALILTVDRPHLDVTTLVTIRELHERRPAAVIQPQYAGRRGHPILYPQEAIDVLLGAPVSTTAREVLARPKLSERRLVVAVDDPAVVDNIDTPADLTRLGIDTTF